MHGRAITFRAILSVDGEGNDERDHRDHFLLMQLSLHFIVRSLSMAEVNRRDRPRRRAAEQCDELAPPHSITSSARCWRIQGTSRPRALAVLRLMTRSNLVGYSTGISPGFAPAQNLVQGSPPMNWLGLACRLSRRLQPNP